MSESLLVPKIKDALLRSRRQSAPCFVGFLNETEISDAELFLASAVCRNEFGSDLSFDFFGGFENAERKMFCALPQWAEKGDSSLFPITALKISHNPSYSLTHRDYLGAFMSLGIVRSKIGDIAVENDGAFAFVHSDIADHIVSQISKIGRVGVKISKADLSDFQIEQSFTDLQATVASNRIDCVCAALLGTSREKAVGFITSKSVFINGAECIRADKRVFDGDAVTVRKKGKFIIDSISSTTKKGRTVLIARKKD